MAKYNKVDQKKFEKLVDTLYDILSCCILCGHRCKVNRLKGQVGVCNAKKLKIASYGPHFGEEEPISGTHGSGTIFFSYCNLHCVYCQNYEISQLAEGEEITEDQLAEIMVELQNKGVHNINFVSPTHFLPQIIKSVYLATQNGLNTPLVYNTGGYDSPEVIKLLSEIIDIYMPDMKYSDNIFAQKYSTAKNYWEINKEVVKQMYHQVGVLKTKNGVAYEGLLIRHLVLPNNVAGSKKIIDFISEEIDKDVYLNIMAQYRPCYKSKFILELSRRITYQEYIEVVRYAQVKGLKNLDVQQISEFLLVNF
jgi:putative pyruvate formate lyase activating enzyme